MNNSILTPEESYSLKLREIYESCGYKFYRMKRFEEYDFYAGKKDFLPPGPILTFTDINGQLMALRPDVTLSIIKHAPSGKYYYDEKVYRVPKNAGSFREIPQCGIECIGSNENVRDVLALAVRSLHTVAEGRKYVLDVADAGIVAGLVPENSRAVMLKLLAAKNVHGLQEADAPRELVELAQDSLIPPKVAGIISGMDCCRVDFSCVTSLSYYNGIVFRGYVEGIPEAVISGGQYCMDGIEGAGFAVYLDAVAGAIAGCRLSIK